MAARTSLLNDRGYSRVRAGAILVGREGASYVLATFGSAKVGHRGLADSDVLRHFPYESGRGVWIPEGFSINGVRGVAGSKRRSFHSRILVKSLSGFTLR